MFLKEEENKRKKQDGNSSMEGSLMASKLVWRKTRGFSINRCFFCFTNGFSRCVKLGCWSSICFKSEWKAHGCPHLTKELSGTPLWIEIWIEMYSTRSVIRRRNRCIFTQVCVWLLIYCLHAHLWHHYLLW